jgi:adenosylcobinamide-GDP ribazoletransferase
VAVEAPPGRRAAPLDRLVVAHLFMTRLPLGGRRAVDERRLARAMVAFPLVGVTVGGAAALARLAGEPLGPAFACVLALAVAPMLTGALHEDGLADTFDALGPHGRGRRLEAMRDPRLGTFGVLALVLSLAARLALLVPLTPGDAAAALVAAHVLGRWSALPLAARAPRARADGAAAWLPRPDSIELAAGSALALAASAPLLLLVGPAALLALPVAAAVTGACGLAWRRAFGGVTGDVCGATNQLVEVSAYVVVAAAVA